jgi:hypothetical protein
MKTDTYTKIILTIIALFLCILVLQNTNPISEARASNYSQAYGLVPLNDDGSITVSISESNTLNVNIEATGGQRIFGRKVPVDPN